MALRNSINKHRDENLSEQDVVKPVAQQAGIIEEQAGKAVVAVLGYVKQNLPAQFHGPIDAAIKGDVSGLAGLADMAGSLGTVFK